MYFDDAILEFGFDCKARKLSPKTIDKLRNNKPLNTTTINDLCRILNCSVSEIMQYVPSEQDQPL